MSIDVKPLPPEPEPPKNVAKAVPRETLVEDAVVSSIQSLAPMGQDPMVSEVMCKMLPPFKQGFLPQEIAAAISSLIRANKVEMTPEARLRLAVAAAKPQKPQKPPNVVEFVKVTKTYGGRKPFTAIKDVSFVVEDLPNVGELIAILGPSGCGKSTVLKLIAGLEPQFPQSEGDVFVLGEPVKGADANRGMVFQEYTAFDNRTVLENVAFGLECRGIKKSERNDLAREWIRKVGLDAAKDADKYPHQLSGGMRQRVAIARTMVLKPRILLMDEPFGALDPMTRLRMQDLLIDLWKTAETTVFFVTHAIPEAVFLGDRIYLFSNSPGTIIEEVRSPRPEEPSYVAQAKPEFTERAQYIQSKIAKMEEERGLL